MRRRVCPSLNVAPLLDVILLLLLFVMLTATFARREAMVVDLPQAGQSVAAPREGIMLVIDQADRVLYEGRAVAGGELERVLARAGRGQGTPLTIAADRKAGAGVLVELMDKARGAGVGDVRISTRPPGSRGPGRDR